MTTGKNFGFLASQHYSRIKSLQCLFYRQGACNDNMEMYMVKTTMDQAPHIVGVFNAFTTVRRQAGSLVLMVSSCFEP